MPIEINKHSTNIGHDVFLHNKVLTDKEKLTLLLIEKGMPGPLIPRLVDQWDGEYSLSLYTKLTLADIVGSFATWNVTKEGLVFWRNVYTNMVWKRDHC